jgi:DNA-binding transcriptional LysR family regulator
VRQHACEHTAYDERAADDVRRVHRLAQDHRARREPEERDEHREWRHGRGSVPADQQAPRTPAGQRGQAGDSLTRGHVDLAVLDDWPEVSLRLPPGIEQTELGLDTADLLVPSGHRLARARSVARTQILRERWISAPPGAICHEWLLRVLPGVEPDLVVGEFETQITLVAAGLGVAMVPRLARPALPDGVVAVAVRPVPTRRVTVAWRTAAAARPATAAALAALRDAWKHYPAAPALRG